MIPYLILMSGVAGLITLMMSFLVFNTIDCSTISNEELENDCNKALNSAWVIVAVLPILLFVIIFQMIGGRTASMRVLSIENIEERSKKMERLGVDHILKKTKAKLIDRSKRGNELYVIDLVKNYPLKYLKYEDPSTPNKTYGCYVPTEITTADAAMGWKYQITEEEYQNDLIYEA